LYNNQDVFDPVKIYDCMYASTKEFSKDALTVHLGPSSVFPL